MDSSDIKLAVGASAGAATYSAVFGALAVHEGWSVWQALAASVLIHAGGSQIVGLAALSVGASPLAALMLGTLVNLRLGAFGFALGNVFTSWRQRLAMSHLVSDESAGAALTRTTPAKRRRTFVVVGVILFVGWVTGTLVGAVFGVALPSEVRSSLDSAAAAAFVALVIPLLHSFRDIALAIAAGGIALLTAPHLAPGLPVLLATVAIVPFALLKRKEATA